MDIDLSSLLVFRHLAQSRSFTQTGKRWNISQPTVSQIVNRLEAETGLILLDRSNSQTKLTTDGIAFLERADEVCDEYVSFISGMREISRRIVHDVNIGLDRSWFSNEIQAAKNQLQCPEDVTAIFTEADGDWMEALASGQLDVVVGCRFLHPGLSANVQEAVIRREKGITIAWNPQFHDFAPDTFSFPDILRTNVLIPDSSQISNFGDSIKLWCEKAYGIQPANLEEFGSEMHAADAAAAGLGILVAPGDAIPRLGQEGQGLAHVKTFEFLLPQALTLGVYCRSDESNKEVLQTAAQVGRLCMKLFPEN